MPTQMMASKPISSNQDSDLRWEAVTGEENLPFEMSVGLTHRWDKLSTSFMSIGNVQIATDYRVTLLGDLTPNAELDRAWDGGMRDRVSVEKVAMNRPFLLGVFQEAYSEIRLRFDSEPILLEAIDSFEHQPEEGKLIIAIQTKLSVDEARAKLKDFDTNWWLPNIRRAEGRLSIILEYI